MTTPTLRAYQTAAVDQIRAHWARGGPRSRVCCVLPTGAGKSVVARAAVASVAPDRLLVLTHTTTLRDQWRRHLPHARIATIQGVVRRGALPGSALPQVVVIDECHHIAAGTWSRTMALLPAGCLVLGLTATPERADGAPLADMFGALVATARYSDLVAAGHLAPLDVRACPNSDPVSAYLRHGAGRPLILFAPTMVDCASHAFRLRAAGVTAATIDATTSPRVRRAALADYDAGRLQALLSPMALAEGFDSPRAAVCVLDRACVHVGTYLQTANRVTRPHPSKGAGAPALLLDCRGAAERHGHPLEDRTYSLDGQPIRRSEQRATEATAVAHSAPRVAAVARRTAPTPVRFGHRVGSALRAAATWFGTWLRA